MLVSALTRSNALEFPENPLLVVDIGNTYSKVALLQGNDILHQASFLTHDQEQYNQLTPWLDKEFSLKNEIPYMAVSSVVPNQNQFWIDVSKQLNCPLFLLSTESVSHLISFSIDHPNQVGADRLAGFLGAKKRYPNQHLVIIDMGTAITLNFLTSSGCYLGGAIFSGLQTSIDHLTQKAALLSPPSVDFLPLTIGKNTEDQLKLNLHFYYQGLKNLIPKIAAQAFGSNISYKVIGTGGDAHQFSNFDLFDVLEPDLKLLGIKEAFIANKKKIMGSKAT